MFFAPNRNMELVLWQCHLLEQLIQALLKRGNEPSRKNVVLQLYTIFVDPVAHLDDKWANEYKRLKWMLAP